MESAPLGRQLSSCEVGVRLVVEVPAQSFELSLAEVHSLQANLHRRPKKSNFALMRACYARLHGVDVATCSHAFSSDCVVQLQAVRRGRARWQERVGGSSEAPDRPRLRLRHRRLNKAHGHCSGRCQWRAARAGRWPLSAGQQQHEVRAPLRARQWMPAGPWLRVNACRRASSCPIGRSCTSTVMRSYGLVGIA